MDLMIDATDRTILKILQDDASISNLELSKRVGLSPSSCLARTKSLRENGVIKNYAAIVDESKLGIGTIAFVLVDLTPLNRKTIHSFLEDVNHFPQVQECYTLTGTHDYLLKIVAPNMDAYRDFLIDSLMANAAVSSVETSMVMGVEKCTTAFPIEIEGGGSQ